MVAHREGDRGLVRTVCKTLVIRCLTRHAAHPSLRSPPRSLPLHANGVNFDLRKVYVSGCES